MHYRTAELARLAEANGFTATETHRAMLDGASKLLKNIAANPQPIGPGWTLDDRALVGQFADGLEVLNSKLTFMEVEA